MEDNESEYRVGKRVPNIVPSDGVDLVHLEVSNQKRGPTTGYIKSAISP